MTPEGFDAAQVVAALDDLRQQMREISERVVALEQSAGHAPATEAADEEISEEVVLAISAAIAAYLGKRAHVRQIRLLSDNRWAQQGRATIQASHTFSIRHA